MKLLAPLLGLLGVQGQKQGIIDQCTAATEFYPNCKCADVFWKGGKVSKILWQNNEMGYFQFSVPDNAGAWKFRTGASDFKFFLQFQRGKCGVSFLDKVAAGDVKFEFMDAYPAYSAPVFVSAVEKFARDGFTPSVGNANPGPKKHWTVTVQGGSSPSDGDFATMQKLPMLNAPDNANKARGDAPYFWKTDSFVTKKDVVYTLVTGLDNVEWATDAHREGCLASGFVGIMPSDNFESDETECMGLAHLYW
jgi:hypothetical protein